MDVPRRPGGAGSSARCLAGACARAPHAGRFGISPCTRQWTTVKRADPRMGFSLTLRIPRINRHPSILEVTRQIEFGNPTAANSILPVLFRFVRRGRKFVSSASFRLFLHTLLFLRYG